VIEKTYNMPGVFGTIKSVARYSDCQKYRYYLRRVWGSEPKPKLVNFLLLNPSKATERDSDPTVKRCETRAKRLFYDGLIVTNLFAYRATEPKDMKAQADPVGLRNLDQIVAAVEESDLVICGWGQNGRYMDQDAQVLGLLRKLNINGKVMALRITHGVPHHPLYVPYSVEPVTFTELSTHG
jgi:hypothetical protein